MNCTNQKDCPAEWHKPDCLKLMKLRRKYRRENNDALSLPDTDPALFKKEKNE